MSDNIKSKPYKGEFICIKELVKELSENPPNPNIAEGEECKPRIALSISGGGAAGAFEAGVIEALQKELKDNGLEISFILGASAGALNAAGVIYEKLGMTNKEVEKGVEDKASYSSYIAKIWSFLDKYPKENNAARFVLNKPNLITSLCKNIIGGKKGSLSPNGVLDVLSQLLNTKVPMYLGIVGLATFFIGLVMLFFGNWTLLKGGETIKWLSLLYTGNIGVFLGWLLVSVGIGLIGTVVLMLLLKEGAFENENLYSTLYKVGKETEMDPLKLAKEHELSQQARNIVSKWYENPEKYPQLILTGTDLTLQNPVLFTLVNKEIYAKLIKGSWYTAQMICDTKQAQEYAMKHKEEYDKAQLLEAKDEEKNYMATPLCIKAENFFDALVSSTSIPAIFPSRHIPLYHLNGYDDRLSKPLTHIFTDGGVLNNSPINVAIDAGATHVISLELGSIYALPFDEFGDQKNAKFSMGETFFRSFTTAMTVSLEKDISASASWNEFLIDHLEIKDKKVVQIYRMSPEFDPPVATVGLVDFNGRYKDGERVTTLTDWMNYGQDIASNKKSFWRATTEAYPIYKGANDDQYEKC